MPIIIQKFGGTAVSTAQKREVAVARVMQTYQQGNEVVVVVSAMGRQGDPYATDTLLGLVQDDACISARDLDLLISCGEIIAAGVFAAALRKHHAKIAVFTGYQAGIITDEMHGNARVIDVQPARMQRLLQDGHIVVVAGFQGISQQNEITTLGRGGSDTTAVALGIALNAETVEIYTDVPGIMTADPRIVSEAKVLTVVDYQEMLQMTYEGARVLNSRAVELAMHNNVRLVVKSPSSSAHGTLISSTTLYESRLQPVISVAHKNNLAQVMLYPEKKSSELDRWMFAALAEQGISVDLININPSCKMFAVLAADIERVQMALANCCSGELKIRAGCSKVSVVGVGMRGIPGVMATFTQALHAAAVEILQTSDSHMTISCLIDSKHLAEAVNALHTHFHLAALG